jgi:transposase, IS5 family
LPGCVPHLIAADAAFYSANAARVKSEGRQAYLRSPIARPKALNANASRKNAGFRSRQKWCTGCEGRARVFKAATRGLSEPIRWGGIGVMTDNLVNIDCVVEQAVEP